MKNFEEFLEKGMQRSYEEWWKIIKRNSYALYYVPEELKTFTLCLEAVKRDGGALPFVPEKFKSFKLCLIAVKKSSIARYAVPKEFLDKNNRILTWKGLKKKYTQEEMLTSNNLHLRILGVNYHQDKLNRFFAV